MLIFKKSELEIVLITISAYNKDTKLLIGGLLNENLTLGTKRRLQKIHKNLYIHYLEFIEDFKKVQEECKEDKEKLEKEIQELLDEKVEIDVEPVKISLIEDVSTSDNYNFDIIEKFAI